MEQVPAAPGRGCTTGGSGRFTGGRTVNGTAAMGLTIKMVGAGFGASNFISGSGLGGIVVIIIRSSKCRARTSERECCLDRPSPRLGLNSLPAEIVHESFLRSRFACSNRSG